MKVRTFYTLHPEEVQVLAMMAKDSRRSMSGMVGELIANAATDEQQVILRPEVAE